ncbi:MAG TPA: DUF305 domain-containing protein [Pseudonocardia sp.]
MTTRSVATRLAAATLTVTTAAALTGCGTGDTDTTTPPAGGTTSAAPAHNQADITFAQGMIPHHRQAVEMSRLAATRTTTPGVTDLAAAIRSAQQPEIDQLTGFLRTWDAPLPSTDDPSMGGMDHSAMGHGGMQGGGMDSGGMDSGGMEHGGMSGMMSGDELRRLGQANGAAFDAMFLRMMIGHHDGAVAMATAELRDGTNPEARALAQRVIDAQQREIAEMRSMLERG